MATTEHCCFQAPSSVVTHSNGLFVFHTGAVTRHTFSHTLFSIRWHSTICFHQRRLWMYSVFYQLGEIRLHSFAPSHTSRATLTLLSPPSLYFSPLAPQAEYSSLLFLIPSLSPSTHVPVVCPSFTLHSFSFPRLFFILFIFTHLTMIFLSVQTEGTPLICQNGH